MRPLSLLLAACSTVPLFAQNISAENNGQKQFDNRCAVCHGGDGMGGELGPAIGFRIASKTDQELAAVIRDGLPARGMPASNLSDPEMNGLIGYLRTLRARRRAEPVHKKIETTAGQTLEGLVLSESATGLQLRTPDKRVHLLRKDGARWRPVTSQLDWTSYNGDIRGNRYTKADQITKANVAKLSPRWVFALPNAGRVETTPVVSQGMMFVTSANECWALDAGSGRELWHFQRPRTRGLTGNAAGGFNRGVAIAGERVFLVSDHAHLLALDRWTGELLWDTEMADWHRNYNATSAPLAIGDLVVSGTAGGEQGVRGFLAAFSQSTGKEVWRFWTVPRPGEPGSETWKGKSIDHPAAATWFTGTYDPQLDTIYWPTGNPGPDYNDAEREGDNLYSCSILALDAKTGKLKWHYQFTPHDVFDWDATEPPVLVDADWRGQPRKLLLQANRSGFFYVLDRTDGKLLLGKPFVKKITWANEIGADGRPVRLPLPKVGNGTEVCPSQDGATNWFSTAFHPGTGLYYVQTLEKCGIYVKRPADWEAGRGYLGGSSRPVPGERAQKILRAIDIQTGRIAWELPEVGDGTSWGGVLATSTGVLFVCDDSGLFEAVDAGGGEVLWSFETNQTWKASPMTYVFDGKQYVAVAAGPVILAFGLQ